MWQRMGESGLKIERKPLKLVLVPLFKNACVRKIASDKCLLYFLAVEFLVNYPDFHTRASCGFDHSNNGVGSVDLD